MTRIKNNLKLLTKKASSEVKKELDEGSILLNSIKEPIVSFLGSHVTKATDDDYKHARKVANILGKEGYAVVTGGGPGIMRAANVGAFQAKAPSIGIRAGLIKGEDVNNNPYTHLAAFNYLFIRRALLAIKSEALLFYPGGYGTLNELFEYVVLIETGMVDKVPLICVNKKYWNGLFKWLKKGPLKQGLFSHNIDDLKLITICDDPDEVIELIKGKE